MANASALAKSTRPARPDAATVHANPTPPSAFVHAIRIDKQIFRLTIPMIPTAFEAVQSNEVYPPPTSSATTDLLTAADKRYSLGAPNFGYWKPNRVT
jgi:hypothetical protein